MLLFLKPQLTDESRCKCMTERAMLRMVGVRTVHVRYSWSALEDIEKVRVIIIY
jgi:hypothetical protein